MTIRKWYFIYVCTGVLIMSESTKPCKLHAKGCCRFGYRCRFLHEQVEEVFTRLTLGDRGKVALNVKVLLGSHLQEELQYLLNSTSVKSISQESDKDSESSSEDEEYKCDLALHKQQRKVEANLKKKYSHIPDSNFKRMFMDNVVGNTRLIKASEDEFHFSLQRDSVLDYDLKVELSRVIEGSAKMKEMLAFRSKLPVYEKRQEILDLIEQNQVVVISGETGCGKTTQVVQYILDDYITKDKGSLCSIVCTQPRRISAISVAQRVANERFETNGGLSSVGYQIRLEKSLPRKQGSILYCTTGILLQWLRSDPGLSAISHVIIDEIHERNIDSDFVMAVLRDIVPHRKDLRVILMSATLNADQFSTFFNKCPMLEIKGHVHPVEVFYLEDAYQLTGYVKEGTRNRGPRMEREKVDEFHNFIVPYVRSLEKLHKYSDVTIRQLLSPESEFIDLKLIVHLIEYISTEKDAGAILVFLPGWELISSLFKEIQSSAFFCNAKNFGSRKPAESEEAADEAVDDKCEETEDNIMTGLKGKFLVLPLHSKMPTVNQSQVFNRPPEGVRKIIISTNIAETSITIDDVVYIVDSGKMKTKNYDIERNISTLQDEWVSLANAKQRRGRAGRVQPGESYHLFTRARERILEKYPKPEMLRTRLENLILQIKILQLGKVKSFLERVMEPPNLRTVEASLQLLQTLKALDEDEHLTPLGFHLAKLPLDPHIGKMILMGAIFSCVDPVFSIAACLSEKDPFVLPLGKDKEVKEVKTKLSKGKKSDHLIYAEGFRQWEEAVCKRKGGQFCRKNFMSGNTLRTLRELKSEFAKHLNEMGFLSSPYSKDPEANRNSEIDSVVRAVICAGLYPNVAMVEKIKFIRNRGEYEVCLKTPEDGDVKLHRVSINDGVGSFESPYLMYHQKLKSSYIFIHDSTMMPSIPLLIFGHKINRRGSREIVVNDIIAFRCNEELSKLVLELRSQILEVLDQKTMNPGSTDWTSNCRETKILRALVEIITDEDNTIFPPKEEEGKKKESK